MFGHCMGRGKVPRSQSHRRGDYKQPITREYGISRRKTCPYCSIFISVLYAICNKKQSNMLVTCSITSISIYIMVELHILSKHYTLNNFDWFWYTKFLMFLFGNIPVTHKPRDQKKLKKFFFHL